MRILDLYCGAGGAAVGYARAGFEVTGVDIAAQPDYPYEFHRSDALAWLRSNDLSGFDAIHASPPCQAASALTKGTQQGKREHPNWIPQTRRALKDTGLPYVIENVIGSDLRKDLILCGEMFGLGVVRHRYFEIGNAGGFKVPQPQHLAHRGRVRGWEHGTYYDGPYRAVYGKGGAKGKIHEWQDAMGIDWTRTRRSIAEAIPPAYTTHIGKALLDSLQTEPRRLKVLDLYCGEGGASIGYHQAGYAVVGVDTNPLHRRYYPYVFKQAHAIGYLLAHGHEYDLIHASPPCQRYTAGTRAVTKDYPDLIAPTRKALNEVGVPWIIENVEGAPLIDPILLCGTMFDLIARSEDPDGRSKLLHLHRHRLFESSMDLTAPRKCSHLGRQVAGVYDGGRRDPIEARTIRKGGYTPNDPMLTGALMGTDWHGTRKGLFEAIPPAYTAWLGSQAAKIVGQ